MGQLQQQRRQSEEASDLSDTLQGELLHEVDDVGLLQELLLELLYSHREGGRVQADLSVWGAEVDELLYDGLELRGQELVSLQAQQPLMWRLSCTRSWDADELRSAEEM